MSNEITTVSDLHNLDTHWFVCMTCGGISWDSDTAQLAGKTELTPANVSHDRFCPGKASPENHVRRITRTY